MTTPVSERRRQRAGPDHTRGHCLERTRNIVSMCRVKRMQLKRTKLCCRTSPKRRSISVESATSTCAAIPLVWSNTRLDFTPNDAAISDSKNLAEAKVTIQTVPSKSSLFVEQVVQCDRLRAHGTLLLRRRSRVRQLLSEVVRKSAAVVRVASAGCAPSWVVFPTESRSIASFQRATDGAGADRLSVATDDAKVVHLRMCARIPRCQSVARTQCAPPAASRRQMCVW